MLRAAKNIDLKTKMIISKDAFLIAPAINICGIIIRCDKTTSMEIKSFFASFGANVGRVRYKDELFARITGTFQIPLVAIEKFITENKDLVEEQNLGADDIPESIIIKKDIEENFDNRDKPKLFSIGNTVNTFQFKTGFESAQGSVTMHVSEFQLHGRILAAKNIIMKAGVEHHLDADLKYGEAPLGFMSEVFSKQNINFSAPSIVVDSVVMEAASSLKLEGDHQVFLRIEEGVDWINNPHPETNSIRLAKRIFPQF